MTINQGIPLQGVANTTISIETKNMTVDLEALLDKLKPLNIFVESLKGGIEKNV